MRRTRSRLTPEKRFRNERLLRRNGAEEIGRRRVVSESVAEVRVQIDVAGTEDKASAQLKGVAAQAMLAMPCRAGPSARDRVFPPQEMKERCPAKARRTVGLPFVVNQERKGDSTFSAEGLRVVQVSEPDGGQARAFLLESPFMIAQLRDVLAAEDSTVVAKEHNHRGPAGPKRAQLDWISVDVGQADFCEKRTERWRHWEILCRDWGQVSIHNTGDIFLGAHGVYFGLEAKYPRMKASGTISDR